MPFRVYNSIVKLIEIPDSKYAIVLCREKLSFLYYKLHCAFEVHLTIVAGEIGSLVEFIMRRFV